MQSHPTKGTRVMRMIALQAVPHFSRRIALLLRPEHVVFEVESDLRLRDIAEEVLREDERVLVGIARVAVNGRAAELDLVDPSLDVPEARVPFHALLLGGDEVAEPVQSVNLADAVHACGIGKEAGAVSEEHHYPPRFGQSSATPVRSGNMYSLLCRWVSERAPRGNSDRSSGETAEEGRAGKLVLFARSYRTRVALRSRERGQTPHGYATGVSFASAVLRERWS